MSSKRSKSPQSAVLPAGLTEQLLQAIDPLPAPPEALARARRVLMRAVAAAGPVQVSTHALSGARFKPYLTGVQRAVLQRDNAGETWLLRLEPGATLPEHDHVQGDEWSLVLEGACTVDGEHLTAGDTQYAPPGSHHGAIHSPGGCLLWLRLTPLPGAGASPASA